MIIYAWLFLIIFDTNNYKHIFTCKISILFFLLLIA